MKLYPFRESNRDINLSLCFPEKILFILNPISQLKVAFTN